jgi:hypothetical protein
METWADVPGFEGRYQVNKLGSVRSLLTTKLLKPNLMNHGYTCVHLYNGGKKTRKVWTIHQLVATVFLPNPTNLREVNHKNFIRQDNHIDNLEWISRRDNVLHAIAAGRRVKPEIRIKGIHLGTGAILTFDSQVAAEDYLCGGRTGGISHAMAIHRPAYGYVWWLA